MEDAATRLEGIAEDVSSCTRCAELLEGRVRAVPGGGHPHAHLMVVTAHPSEADESSGRPAGASLVDALTEVFPGLDEESGTDVYVTSLVKCVPRSNGAVRQASDAERSSCYAFLSAEISTITPHFLLPVGRETSTFILERLFGQCVTEVLPPPLRVLESPAFRVVPVASRREIGALPEREQRQYLEQLRSLAARIGI